MNVFRENPLFFFMDDTHDMMPEEFNEVGKIIEISDVGCDARTPRSSSQKIVDKLHINNFTKRENRGDSRLSDLERIDDHSSKNKNQVKDDSIRNEEVSMNVNYEDLEVVSDTQINEKSKSTGGRFKDSSIGTREKSEASYKKFRNTNRHSTRGLDDIKRNVISEKKENLVKNEKRVPINKKESFDTKDVRKPENVRYDKYEEFIGTKENSDLSYDKRIYKGIATCADSLSNLSKRSNASDVSVKSSGSKIFENSTKFFDNYSKRYTVITTMDSAASKELDLISDHVNFDGKGNLKKSKSEISTKDSGNLTIEEIRARRTRTKDILEPKCKYPRCDDWESYTYESKDHRPPHGNRLLVERGESPINLEIETSSIHLRKKDVIKISRGQSPIRLSDIHPVSRDQNSVTKSFFSWGKCQGNGNSVSLKSTSGKSVATLRKRVSEIPRPIKTKILEKKKVFNSSQKTMLGGTQQNRRTRTEFSPKTKRITERVKSSIDPKIKIEKSQEDPSEKKSNLKSRSLDSTTREADAPLEGTDWTEERKRKVSSVKSKKYDEKKMLIEIRQGKNIVLENSKKSKIPAVVPRENTKSETSAERNGEMSENIVKTKSTKIDGKSNIFNQDESMNIESDVIPIMERDTIESYSFTQKSKIPTFNTLDKVHPNSHEIKIKNDNVSNNQSKSALWNPEYDDAFLKGRAVGMKVIKMAKAARDERKRAYVNHGFDDYKKRPRDTSEEILDIGMTVIENVNQSPEEFLSAKTSEETLDDYPMYYSAHDWSPRNSNETFWFI